MKPKVKNTHTNPNKNSGLAALVEVLAAKGTIDYKDIKKIQGGK